MSTLNSINRIKMVFLFYIYFYEEGCNDISTIWLLSS